MASGGKSERRTAQRRMQHTLVLYVCPHAAPTPGTRIGPPSRCSPESRSRTRGGVPRPGNLVMRILKMVNFSEFVVPRTSTCSCPTDEWPRRSAVPGAAATGRSRQPSCAAARRRGAGPAETTGKSTARCVWCAESRGAGAQMFSAPPRLASDTTPRKETVLAGSHSPRTETRAAVHKSWQPGEPEAASWVRDFFRPRALGCCPPGGELWNAAHIAYVGGNAVLLHFRV